MTPFLPPLAALQAASLAETSQLVVLTVVAAVALVASMVIFFVARYRRCPSNKILVISGRVGDGNAAKCISGGGAFVWPVIQEYGYLDLDPIRLDVPLKDALSLENIRISVPAVFTVAIGTEPDVRQNAAIRLLGLDRREIESTAHDIIVGQLRAIIAAMKIDEINRDRDGFLHKIQHQLEPELKKIGLVLINVNITDLQDSAGYLEALGKQAAASAVQQARGDVAEQEKLGEIRVAQATRERATAVAQAEKDREIALRETAREQAVRLAELDKEQKVGEQTAALERDALVKESQRTQAIRIAQLDKEQKVAEQTAAFEREAQIKESEQKKRISVAAADARAIAGEAEAQATIAGTQAQLQVKQAEAYQVSETRKREAEAAVQEAQNRALAKAALAEAERVEAERRAALEAPARAEAARLIVEAQAEAEKRKIQAQADAAAAFARLEAEARGQYEILAKKGEGLRAIVEACGGADQAYRMLMLEHMDKLAETAAQAISNIRFDKVVVWEGGGSGAGSTAGFLQNMARTLPPMMQVIREIGGVELPAFLGQAVGDGADGAPPAGADGDAPRVPVEKIVAGPEAAEA